MNQWYEIRAAGKPKTAEIYIFGDIGENWWTDQTITAKQFVEDLAAIDADTLNVRINSHGGAVSDGLAIYNALRRHPAQKVVTVEGVAVSIASLIAMAGDTVDMPANSLLMIHAPWGAVQGNAADLRDMAAVLDRFAAAMASSYARKSGRTEADMLALLTDGENHWYTAAEAKAAGFADTVSDELKVAASLPPRFRPGFNPTGVAAMPPETQPQAAAPTSANVPQTPSGTPAPATPPQASALPDNLASIQDAARREALAAEQERRREISGRLTGSLAKRPELQQILAACLDDMNCTPEMASQRFLAKMGESAEPLHGSMSVTADGRDRFIEAASTALRIRAGVTQNDPRNEFRSMRLTAMAEYCLVRAGLNPRAYGDEPAMVRAAITHTTSDFPVLLENTLNKTLLESYSVAAATWKQWCAVGSVADFRPYKRLRMGSFGNLDSLNEAGEYKHKAIPDATAETVSIDTKANTISLTRKAIINDDLGGFVRLGQMLARAAARSIEADAYALLVSNPALDSDSTALFHANHGNLGTGGAAAAITMTSLDTARTAMKIQKDRSGNDYIGIVEPFILLCPVAKAGAARTANESEFDPDTANKLQRTNITRGILKAIVDSPYLSGNPWYLLADPAQFPTVEVLFLNGNQTPYSEQVERTNVDGVVWLIRLDYGVNVVDYVGAYKNDGA